MRKIEITDIERMPHTKALLIEYIYCMYEADAIITNDYLCMEYNMLLSENRLNELFEQELLVEN